MVSKVREKNLTRVSLKAWKLISFHESNKNFESKIKERTELEMKNYETNLVQQQEKIYELIAKAEEKLKLEQKKKIQTKLQLDQVVLRGVSALNIQALKLSQNALNGKISLIFRRVQVGIFERNREEYQNNGFPRN